MVTYNTPAALYAELGGDIANFAKNDPEHYKNACAARMCRALNKVGIYIPFIEEETQQGAGKLNYFLKAIDMAEWMETTFGIPTKVNYSSQLNNGLVYQTGFANGISGHIGIVCNNSVYVTPADGYSNVNEYYKKGAPTYIWH